MMKESSSNLPKLKRKVGGLYLMEFTPDEHEAADGLVLLQTLFQKKKKSLGGQTICENNNVVRENGYNPPLIPTIPGVPNNTIFGCCKPFEKKLSHSDLKVDQNRLFLNKNHVKEYFLPLLRDGEDVEQGIDVVVYDMQGQMFNMKFNFWSKRYYVLNGSGWKSFFESHRLQANQDHVTVWMFRHSETSSLCFALSVRRVQV